MAVSGLRGALMTNKDETGQKIEMIFTNQSDRSHAASCHDSKAFYVCTFMYGVVNTDRRRNL